ncbi:thioredoxin family protein [bacterium]|nr:thioredoxin family protein [bacterium]
MKKILYFSAAWCGPCKQLGPIMESLAGEINYEKIDVDTATELVTEHGIRNIPTMVLTVDGVPTSRQTGLMPRQQILDWYNG